MSKKATKYVVCVNNNDYPAALELGKIYRTLPDTPASTHKLVRVIDESQEDYLYPKACVIAIELTAEIAEALSY